MSEFIIFVLVYLIIGLGIAIWRKIVLVKEGRMYTGDAEDMAIVAAAWPGLLVLLFLEYINDKIEEYFDPDKS